MAGEVGQARHAEERARCAGGAAGDGRLVEQRVAERPDETAAREAGTHVDEARLPRGGEVWGDVARSRGWFTSRRATCRQSLVPLRPTLAPDDGTGMCVQSGSSSKLALACASRMLCSATKLADATPSRKHLTAAPATRAPGSGATAHESRTKASSLPDEKTPEYCSPTHGSHSSDARTQTP